MSTTKIVNNPQSSLILFDGVCNLCNASVNFIMRHDKQGQFKFASLQSDFAKEQLRNAGLNTDVLETIVLFEGNEVYMRSTAALRIARRLNGLWPLLYCFIIVPPSIRNFVYNIIARNRYNWFGKRDQCRVPTVEERNRFVE